MSQGPSGFQSPIVSSSLQSTGQPPGPRWGRWLLIGCGGFIVLFVLCVGGLVLFVFGAFRSSDVVRTAVAQAEANPDVRAALGTPLKVGWLVSGSMNLDNNGGNAK